MARDSTIAIIGLGKFGFQLGSTLMGLGQQVVGLDSDPERIRRAQHVFTQVYHGDAADKEVLRQLGFSDFDQVAVSVGDSIAASTMIVMYLKELTVPRVWVKAINMDHWKLLEKVGADEIIIPEHLAARQLANRIANPGFIEFLSFDQSMSVRELVVDSWAGKNLKQLDLSNRYNLQIIAVKRPGKKEFAYTPRGETLLEKDDRLIAIGKMENFNRITP